MSVCRIKYDKLPTQAKVFDDDLTFTIMQSMGLGGGKTYNLCMKLLKLSKLNKGYAGGVLAPSYPDFKKDIHPTFEEILEVNKVRYRYHKTEKWYLFPWSKAPLWVFTAEKPIAGPNLAYCGINEFSLMPYDRVSEMLRRVRIKNAPFKQRIMVGTPEDEYGWLEEFVEAQEERGPDKFRIHYGDTDENVHIDENYGEELRALLDDKALEVFKSGKIARLGSDYYYYSFDRSKNVTERAEYDPSLIIHVGLDFNVGNMCATFSHKVGNRQMVFNELHLTGDSNTYTMADRLKEMYPKDMMLITCDASGKNRSTSAKIDALSDVKILELPEYGYNVRWKRQNPRHKKRILHMNGLLYHSQLLINPRCKKTIRDLKGTKAKPDYTKDEGKDKSFSHFSDGLDYVCDFEHPFKIDKPMKPISMGTR
jgi:hypothetical protein